MDGYIKTRLRIRATKNFFTGNISELSNYSNSINCLTNESGIILEYNNSSDDVLITFNLKLEPLKCYKWFGFKYWNYKHDADLIVGIDKLNKLNLKITKSTWNALFELPIGVSSFKADNKNFFITKNTNSILLNYKPIEFQIEFLPKIEFTITSEHKIL